MRQRGQSLVEFAVVIPLILLLLSGTSDVGRSFYFKVAAENTAREAAHWATLTDPSGNALDDNAIFQKVAQPSQESFGIGLGLPPQCTSGGTYSDGAPVGTCSGGTSLLRYATPPVSTSMATAGGPSLGNGQSWMFIYPGKSGRTAMGPAPANVAWKVTDVRSYEVAAANAPSHGALDRPMTVAGAFMPTEADAAPSSVDCYGFGAPTGLTAWNASLDPANAGSLTQTENPNVSITPTGNPPANDLFLTVSNTSPSLSGSLTQSWTPAGSNATSAYLNTGAGQTTWTPAGTLTLNGSNPPPPGTYTITLTVSMQNKSTALSVACTQIDQSSTFTLKVFGDPCRTGYANPGGNPFSTTCNRPIVTSVTPSSGRFVGGYSVTVAGTNFDAVGLGNCTNKDTVSFGTVAAAVISCNNTSAVVTVPAAAPSSVDVTVTDANNKTSAVNPPADTFTYLCIAVVGAKPCINSVSPRAETKAGGTSVTITGANFFNAGTCQVTGVTFGSNPATVTSCLSDTTLVVTSPAAAAAGTVDIVVTTSVGASDIGSSDAYTYLDAPGATAPPPNGPTVHQITVTVIYAFVPITPGISLLGGSAVVYVVGEATLKATY